MLSALVNHSARVRAIAASCVLTATLTCQVHRTAHPQETLAIGAGNFVPFGCFSATQFTDARSQILIRSEELPGPGATLVGIEVHGQNTLSLDYSSLEIDVYPTTATSLSTTFADNITTTVDPVLRSTNLRVGYDANHWTPFSLQHNHVHDGVSGLVIEVRKIVDPTTAQFETMDTNVNSGRADLPSMVGSFGGPGSGASTAVTAQTRAAAVSLRLIWIHAPTIRLLSDPVGNGDQFGLGGTVIHIADGTPGSIVANFVGTSFLDTPVFLPPVVGRLLVSGALMNVDILPASGRVQQRIPIPNDNSLIGLYLAYQSVTIDAVTGIVQLTNGVDHFVNP